MGGRFVETVWTTESGIPVIIPSMIAAVRPSTAATIAETRCARAVDQERSFASWTMVTCASAARTSAAPMGVSSAVVVTASFAMGHSGTGC